MIPMLHWQAGLFGRGTQNLVLRNQLAGALATLDRELQVVGEIQRSLLPADVAGDPGLRARGLLPDQRARRRRLLRLLPARPTAAWGMFIADVSGHGTPAAVLMAITHAIAHAQPGTHTPPARAAATTSTTHLVRSYTRGGTFVTAFYAVLDPAKRTLTYSTAGHNPPRLVRGMAA